MKKRLLLSLSIYLSLLAGTAQTIIENPEYRARNNSVMTITKIERSTDKTNVHVHCRFHPNFWIQFGSDLRLKDTESGREYPVISATGTEIGKQTYIPESGETNFILTFPPLPEQTDTVDWGDQNWSIWGIVVNNTPKQKSENGLPETIRGNWLKTDGSNSWTYGFYDRFAILDNRFWKYEQIKAGKKKIVLSLRSDDDSIRQITIRIQKSGDILVQEGKGKTELYSQKKQASTGYTDPDDCDYEQVFRSDSAWLQGYLKGYDPVLGFSTGVIYLQNILTFEDYPTTVTFHPDGRFEAGLKLNHPVYTRMLIGHYPIDFYIEPGQTLTLYLDWNDLLDKARSGNRNMLLSHTQSMGPGSRTNQNLFEIEAPNINFGQVPKTITATELDELQQLSMQKEEQRLKLYFDQNYVTKKAQHLLRNESKLTIGIQILEFLAQRSPRRQANTAVSKPNTDGSYYRFLQQMPLNDTVSIVCHSYATFVNRYEFIDCFTKDRNVRLRYIVSYPRYAFIDFLSHRNISLEPDDKTFLTYLKERGGKKFYLTETEYQEEEEKNKRIFDRFRKEWIEYAQIIEKSRNPNEKEDESELFKSTAFENLEDWRYRDAVLDSVLFLPPSFTHNITKVRNLNSVLQALNEHDIARFYTEQVCKSIKEPVLQEAALYLLNKIQPQQALTAYELPAGKGTDVFRKIIDPYKGKYLFIDFWATTCGPCRAGIKKMAHLREKYRNSADVKMIYITSDQESPLPDYDQFVEQHLSKEAVFRIPQSDYNYLRELFRFNGIPRYILVDREGRIIDDHFNEWLLESKLNEWTNHR